jgi:peptide/nickel transport system ATP-binding protein
MNENNVLIEVKGLKTYFYLREGTVRAVDGVTFNIRRGQTLGVVGESGCGKSVTAQSIMRLVESPGRIVEGEIPYHRLTPGSGENGKLSITTLDLTSVDPRSSLIRNIRGGEIAMIFQDPMTSFSPVHTIGSQIMEALILHQGLGKNQALQEATQSLRNVGMPNPERVVEQYPHQLSGGMRQRAMIAMALSCNPSLLIADEPTTALDVTTQAQILELLQEMKQSLGMAIMFITHDLGVIAEMADEVVVMYLGKVMEQADVVSLFEDPKHPYTRALLRSIPRVDADIGGRLEVIEGGVPDPYSVPEGCPFHPRCVKFMDGVCDVAEPPFVALDGRRVYCHLYTPKEGDEV